MQHRSRLVSCETADTGSADEAKLTNLDLEMAAVVVQQNVLESVAPMRHKRALGQQATARRVSRG